MNIMKNIGHYLLKFIFLTNIFTMALLILIIYWSVFPRKILEFKKDNFKILTKQVKIGGVLKYQAHTCKYVNSPATVTRSFINGVIFSTPSFESNKKIGCCNDVISVKVPPELEAGRYYIRNTYVYRLNPVRTVTFIHQSEMFEIIN